MLSQTATHLSAVKAATREDFQRVESALQLMVIARRGGIHFQTVFAEILEAVCSWFTRNQRKVKNVSSES